MKTRIFAGAAIAALMSAGAAHANGYVGAAYQSTDFGGGSDTETPSINGAILLGEHFQLNGHYATNDDIDVDAIGLDAFLFNRGETSAIGGYASYQSIDLGPSSADEWGLGVFGQLYRGNTTWTGQLGYNDTEGDVSVIHLDGEWRHFFTDNFSVQGNLGYGDVEVDSGGGGDYWSAGLGAEWRFTGTPISIYGGWQHVDIENGEIDSIGIGARLNFGAGSLLDRNRSGASLNRAAPTYFEVVFGGNSGFTPR